MTFKNQVKSSGLSSFDIFIALLIKFYASYYLKNQYLFSFMKDTREKSSEHYLGNNFLIVDILIKSKDITELNVHELAAKIKHKRVKIAFPHKKVGLSDIVFNPFIVSNGIKIKWPSAYKSLCKSYISEASLCDRQSRNY